MKKSEDMKSEKGKEIDTSSFVTGLSEYDTSNSIHFIARCVSKSSETCDLCMDIMPSNAVNTVNRCKHRFCNECYNNYLAKTIQQDIHQVMCPGLKCKTVISIESLANFVPEQVFYRWKSSLIEASALEQCNMIVCPIDGCSGVFRDDGKNFFIRACPECCKLFCTKCMVEWHENVNCVEFQRSRRYERYKFGSRRHPYYLFHR